MSQQTSQSVRVDRITLIYDDDSTNRIYGGRVRYHNGKPEVLVETQYVPREHLGMEVVAAYDDGTVETAFEVREIDQDTGTRVWA